MNGFMMTFSLMLILMVCECLIGRKQLNSNLRQYLLRLSMQEGEGGIL